LDGNHEHLHNKTVDYFFHQLVFHILCKLTDIFSVLLQLKDLISENMKITK